MCERIWFSYHHSSANELQISATTLPPLIVIVHSALSSIYPTVEVMPRFVDLQGPIELLLVCF